MQSPKDDAFCPVCAYADPNGNGEHVPPTVHTPEEYAAAKQETIRRVNILIEELRRCIDDCSRVCQIIRLLLLLINIPNPDENIERQNERSR